MKKKFTDDNGKPSIELMAIGYFLKNQEKTL